MKTDQDWLLSATGQSSLTLKRWIRAIQADALEHAAIITEEYQRRIWRVDSPEAEAARSINCQIRDEARNLLTP